MRDISEHKYLFHRGRDYRSYEMLGVHKLDGGGFVFRVWAPHAAGVSLAGDCNGWVSGALPMKRLPDDETIWEIETDLFSEGDCYKFAVETRDGRILFKADPYAFLSEDPRIETGSMRASRVYDVNKEFDWDDGEWLSARKYVNPYKSAMNIYEVHLGSWKYGDDGEPLSYEQLSEELISYVSDMGYTHIEILPVMEHPFDGSWGYQVTGYYSVTARYGRPEGFKTLVNAAHKAGIGVILDWVPAHFPKDDFGLAEFDGEPLYEYSDPVKREHKGWGTAAFDYGRPEIVSFLVSNAFYYCEKFHADGLRVDAVAAMLYLNYGREDGEWRPNEYGGVENREAVAFLQRLNQDVLSNFPGVLTIAEESTAWPNVTKPPHAGGLGFNYKWNMGWMNDVLEYMQCDPLYRGGSHNKLTFSVSYAYSENYVLPISHDEVVHGKRSVLDRMPGDYDDKFDGMKAFLVYMYSHPGKKLTFMGSEFAQFIEWDEKKQLDWLLLGYDRHREMQEFVKTINNYYRSTKALWYGDDIYDGFDWIDADNSGDSVYTYMRTSAPGGEQVCVIALNMSGKDFPEYDIGVPDGELYETMINSNEAAALKKKLVYEVKEGARNGFAQHITVRLPRLCGVILEKRGDGKAGEKAEKSKRTSQS